MWVGRADEFATGRRNSRWPTIRSESMALADASAGLFGVALDCVGVGAGGRVAHAGRAVHLKYIWNAGVVFENVDCSPEIAEVGDGAFRELDGCSGRVEVVIVAVPSRGVPDWKTVGSRWLSVRVKVLQALMNELAVEDVDSIFALGENDSSPEIFLCPLRRVWCDDVEAFFVVAVSAKYERAALYPSVCLVEVGCEIGAGYIGSFEALELDESADDCWMMTEGAGLVLEQGLQFLCHGGTWNVEAHRYVPPEL